MTIHVGSIDIYVGAFNTCREETACRHEKPNVQECDATGDAMRYIVGFTKNQLF